MITISYTASVLVDAGWRSISIEAKAMPSKSGKMAEVAEVLKIDGAPPRFNMSRTGAKRQQFNGEYIARREIGARKRVACCKILECAQ